MNSILSYWRVCYRTIALVLNQLLFTMVGLVLFFTYKGNTKKYWKQTSKYSRHWARWTCSIMNINVKVAGEKVPPPGSLIVANHVGTTDILVLGSIFDIVFVSKLEISQWPLVGWTARLGGTIFIDRSKRHNVSRMVLEIEERLRNGCSVAIFPEGGIVDEVGIRPFKPSAFEGAIKSKANVVPVFINYFEKNKISVARWKGTSFLAHILAILKTRRLDVSLKILPSISIQEEKDRRLLADYCYQSICKASDE
jgi:1-acyl-sn-glycerol-3-phosphate acyltransferase